MKLLIKVFAVVFINLYVVNFASAESWGHHKKSEIQIMKIIKSISNDSVQLTNLLTSMPKGGDLHSHTSGAVNMEKIIHWGAEDGVCVDTATYTASLPPCKGSQVSMAQAESDPNLFNNVLMAWTMADFAGTLSNAHQHFFDSFNKFGAVLSNARADDELADILSAAGRQNQIYVELLQGLNSSTVSSATAKYFSSGDTWNEAYLLQKRNLIIADPVFISTLKSTVTDIDNTVTNARIILGCNTAIPDPGCNVEPRFLVSANRTKDRGQVFSQWVYAYELIQASPWVVGVNLVSPEEDSNSLLYYNDEMTAVDVLNRFNNNTQGRRKGHVSLHAGELIPSVLPQTAAGQQQLSFHIRNAIGIAHAERIGHGADILNEISGAGIQDLFNTLHNQNVLIEICLSSNQALLGMKGNNHPLNYYIYNSVPVTLATDDQGVLRNDITTEYVKAITEHQIKYPVLKDMVRASLEHSFLTGSSLWMQANVYDEPVADCSGDNPLNSSLSASCAQYLKTNQRAAIQWKLEKQILQFELAANTGITTVSLNASSIPAYNQTTTTLNWESSNASSCQASTTTGWSGQVPLSGSIVVNQKLTTTYTLTCNGNSGYNSRSATVFVNDPAGCLFNWAENNYPLLLSPTNYIVQVTPPYTYQYFKGTNSYAGISSVDNDVYYKVADGSLQDVGGIADWLFKAGCP